MVNTKDNSVQIRLVFTGLMSIKLDFGNVETKQKQNKETDKHIRHLKKGSQVSHNTQLKFIQRQPKLLYSGQFDKIQGLIYTKISMEHSVLY